MNHFLRRTLPLASLALLLGACASGGELPLEARLARPPKLATGFAVNTHNGLVTAQARFADDHVRVFDVDLIERHGVIPIALRLGLKGETAQNEIVYVDPGKMDLRLYLEDDTALAAADPATIAGDDEELLAALEKFALKAGNLKLEDQAKDVFVYFRLPKPADFAVDGPRLDHRVGRLTRALALDRSLLTFRIDRPSTAPLVFFLGIGRV